MFRPPEKYRMNMPQSFPWDAYLLPGMTGTQRDQLYCIASDGDGWEHVSVTVRGVKRTPTWAEMDYVKRKFWGKHYCVLQYHVPEADHVNRHDYCLHLWRPTEEDFPRPPKEMVG